MSSGDTKDDTFDFVRIGDLKPGTPREIIAALLGTASYLVKMGQTYPGSACWRIVDALGLLLDLEPELRGSAYLETDRFKVTVKRKST